MTHFYVSIIFIGIVLVAVSLFLILYDRKRAYDGAIQLSEKKTQLESMINDAEEMIEELNKFSDYIVTRMDTKNQEMEANLQKYQEQVEQLEIRISKDLEELKKCKNARIISGTKAVNGNEREVVVHQEKELFKSKSDLIIENAFLESDPVLENSRPISKNGDKVIPINSRQREVIRMAGAGLSNTEIARRLNMGKGEIQLILDLNQNNRGL